MTEEHPEELAIFDALLALEQQRARGELAHADTPLRLFRTRAGDFVRVLDAHAPPLSPASVRDVQYQAWRVCELTLGVTAEQLDAIQAFFGQQEAKPAEVSEDPNLDAFIANAGADFEARAADSRRSSTGALPTASPLEATNETIAADSLLPAGAKLARVDESSTSADTTPTHNDTTGPSWAASPAETPEDVIGNGGLMSMLFGSEIEPGDDEAPLLPTSENVIIAASPTAEVPSAEPIKQPLESFAMVCERWPVALEERRRICYMPSPEVAAYYEQTRTRTPCVLYWMRSTLRATHGNFALESALFLAQRLELPLVTMCLVPNATVYPTCHASNVNDAFSRWSFADVQQQFQQAGLPFVGITGSTAPKKTTAAMESGSAGGGYPLFQLFDWFSPYVVVADDPCDLTARRDLDQLAQFLHTTRSTSSWALLAVDSDACVPIYSRLGIVQRTLVAGEQYLGEDAFNRVYSEYYQKRGGEACAFTQLEITRKLVAGSGTFERGALAKLLRQLQLEEADWRIVEALNAQSSPEMAPFSEMDALQKLDRLLAESSDRPAIQAELQGEGILSLLPYIRHGTLFSGYVLHQLAAAISSFPPCRTGHDRKRLAMLKVMRSRALTHLGRERDYALYLAIWTSIQCQSKAAGQILQHAFSFSRCFPLEALSCFSPPSSLDAYSMILPSWISNNSKFGALDPPHALFGGAAYDPYELESARTDDLYWNDIQKFLMENRYLHPLLVVYWSYRILQWSISSQAAIATIESLLHKCSLGSATCPDAVFTVWSQLFRLGKQEQQGGIVPSTLQRVVDEEIASQPKLAIPT
ncbi:hypothetical protein PybrP1_003567 [[Pythium] brassicae (nom. inval.)]|nr:hypothetical protein PybrP1_003567 [[Pythium] brassicae (nom. inval.)]